MLLRDGRRPQKGPEVSHPCNRIKSQGWGTGHLKSPGRERRTRLLMSEQGIVIVPPEAAGQRLDQFLTSQLDGVSRSRVQLLLEQGDVLVDGGAPESIIEAARWGIDRHQR